MEGIRAEVINNENNAGIAVSILRDLGFAFLAPRSKDADHATLVNIGIDTGQAERNIAGIRPLLVFPNEMSLRESSEALKLLCSGPFGSDLVRRHHVTQGIRLFYTVSPGKRASSQQ